MGCINACVCGGMCGGCSSYRAEQYFGHAEDILSQQMGYSNFAEYQSSQRQPEPEYPDEMLQKYWEEQARHNDIFWMRDKCNIMWT